MSSPEDDEEEEAGLSDSSLESDSNCFRFFAEGGFTRLAFLGGGVRLGGRGSGVVVVRDPSLCTFTSLASPTPIPRQSPATSHTNHPTSPKCAHEVGL